MSDDQSLLELLACPKCHGKLARIGSPDGFACERCALFYAIEDGLPNMLIEEAKAWPQQAKPAPGRA
jgi:uncharacterized protein YbaR (Trm112 family)